MHNLAGRRDHGSAMSPRDPGVTFVEVLVTIVLMGTVLIGILAAVRTSIQASSMAESAAEIETLLVNAVDRVNRADNTDCDFESEVGAAVETYGWPASSAQVVHEYLQPDGSWSLVPGVIDCEDQIRRIRITLTHPDKDIVRRLEVVKGDF